MDTCSASGDGCACDRTSDRYPLTRKLCPAHYAQSRRGKPLTLIGARASKRREHSPCSFGGCERTVSAKGLCRAHCGQKSAGRPLTPVRRKRGSQDYQAMLRSGVVECLGCGESKPVSAYSPLNRAGGLRPYCKLCNSERVRLAQYNLTKDFLDRLLGRQEGRCAICGTVPSAGHRPLHIDHDHGCCAGARCCGACVRGLVCSNCNAYGLAWYEALPTELRTFDLLNDYLADPPAQRLRREPA
ncbi:hypothetical protein GPA10_35145 [Streptomyces sp. p1417]|uniref:Recombination endonuclease VII n=1 Tax=Streptomyces typhae TaxID=2681492 RepID=A0A6L6X7P2_9ACTN|nr:hypothetical protein [Streptomyces typhae]